MKCLLYYEWEEKNQQPIKKNGSNIFEKRSNVIVVCGRDSREVQKSGGGGHARQTNTSSWKKEEKKTRAIVVDQNADASRTLKK